MHFCQFFAMSLCLGYIYIYMFFLNDFDLLVVPIGVFGPEGTTGWNVWAFFGLRFSTVDRREPRR